MCPVGSCFVGYFGLWYGLTMVLQSYILLVALGLPTDFRQRSVSDMALEVEHCQGPLPCQQIHPIHQHPSSPI